MIRKILLFCFILSVLSLPSAGYGQWWENDSMAASAKLTKTQIDEMNRIFDTYKARRGELTTQSQRLTLDLDQKMLDDTFDEKTFREKVREISENRKIMLKEMGEMKLEIRRLLNTNQVKILVAEDPRIFKFQRRWDKGRQKTRSRSMKKSADETKKDKAAEAPEEKSE